MTTNSGFTTDQLDSAPDVDRHARLCIICRHPYRDHIDFDFIHWGQPETIVREYHLRSRKNLYRHARATGLYYLRSRNIRSALDHVIEHIADTQRDPSPAIQAVRIYAHINDSGSWVEPSRRLVIAKEIPAPEQVELILAPSLAAGRRAREEAMEADERARQAAREREQLAAQQPERATPKEPERIATPPSNPQIRIPSGSAKCPY
jgi:hypothetical protein